MKYFLLPILLFLSLAFAFPSNVTVPYNYPLFKQCNSSWGNDLMVTTTICKVGCLMSSCSMALNGKQITIDGKDANPGTLNSWLRAHNGYDNNNDLYETAIPNINKQHVAWMGKKIPGSSIDPVQVKTLLKEKDIIVIANVMHGEHFVLVVGFDSGNERFYVNDPGFDREYYEYTEIVGWRLFKMTRI